MALVNVGCGCRVTVTTGDGQVLEGVADEFTITLSEGFPYPTAEFLSEGFPYPTVVLRTTLWRWQISRGEAVPDPPPRQPMPPPPTIPPPPVASPSDPVDDYEAAMERLRAGADPKEVLGILERAEMGLEQVRDNAATHLARLQDHIAYVRRKT